MKISKTLITYLGERALEIQGAQNFKLRDCIIRAVNENPDTRNCSQVRRNKIISAVASSLSQRPRKKKPLDKLKAFLEHPLTKREARDHERNILAGVSDP